MGDYLNLSIEEGRGNTDRYEEYMVIVDGATSPIPNEYFSLPPLEWRVEENNQSRESVNEATASSPLFPFESPEETSLDESGDGFPGDPWGTFDENVETNERFPFWLTTTTTTVTTVTTQKITSTSYTSPNPTTPTTAIEIVSRWTANTTAALGSPSHRQNSTAPSATRPLIDANSITERAVWGTTTKTATTDPDFNPLSKEHVIIISSVCAVFVVLIAISLLLWFLMLRKKVRRRRVGVGVESQDGESENGIDVLRATEHPEGNRTERPSINGSKRSNNSSEGNNMHLHSAIDEPRRQAWTNGTNS